MTKNKIRMQKKLHKKVLINKKMPLKFLIINNNKQKNNKMLT